jgi:hypothetical protein
MSVEEGFTLVLIVVGFLGAPLKILGLGWPAYLLPDLLAVLVMLIVFCRRFDSGLRLFAPTPMTKPLLLLSGYCILELANPQAPLVRSVVGLRSWLLYLGFYYVGFYSFNSLRQLQRLYGLLLVLGSVTAAYGIYQWFAGPTAFLNWSEYYAQYIRMRWVNSDGTHVFRAFSTYGTPGIFGGNMAVLAVIGLGIATSRSVSGPVRLLVVAALVLMGTGIAAAGSRAPVVHLVVMTSLVPFVTTRFTTRVGTTLKVAVIAFVAVVLVTMSPIAPAVAQRFATLLDPQMFVDVWADRLVLSFQRAVENPIGFGLGYTGGLPAFLKDAAFQNLPTGSVDSGYASAALELGIFGFVCFVYFCLRIAIEGIRAWRRIPSGPLKDLMLGPALWAGAYPIWSVVLQPHATLPTSIYCWLLLGMLIKAPAVWHAHTCESHLHSLVALPRTAMAGTPSSSQHGSAPSPPWRSGPVRSRTR